MTQRRIVHKGDANREWTPLHEATVKTYFVDVHRLLDARAAMSSPSCAGVQVIHLAASTPERPIILRLLLDRHADVEVQDDDGFRPLHVATNESCADAIPELLRARADPRADEVRNCFIWRPP